MLDNTEIMLNLMKMINYKLTLHLLSLLMVDIPRNPMTFIGAV